MVFDRVLSHSGGYCCTYNEKSGQVYSCQTVKNVAAGACAVGFMDNLCFLGHGAS